MATLTKLIVSTILGLLMMSCNFDMNFNPGVKGNGIVTTETRSVEGEFDVIKVSRGIDVFLTQTGEDAITVEADENLHEIIMTEVEDGVLRIYADENIARSKAQKVMVSFENVRMIKATSGSDVVGDNTITADELTLETSSGADMRLDINATTVDCSSSSGSDMRLSGKTDKLYAEASSGSDIKAGNLEAVSTQVKASSGADVTVNTSKELTAKASSGGDIKYYGNPEKVNKSDGVSGSIRKRN
ncbi:DUF2807 domain-containing protein [Winogradskyella sp. 3972H.M.0a.05]|uniref:head GIN domain-containing protein n=1 Tax=Winogradskyella sp. 3972H.M.0a.05 TaxID=2950277 RepID=UPI0033986B6D